MSEGPAPAATDPEPHPPEPGRQAALGRSYAQMLGGSVGVLACNLFTGVVSARLLAPEGRGVVGAIAAWAMLTSVIAGLGYREGMAFLESRDHRRAPRTLTLSLWSILVCGSLGFVAAQLLIPLGFRAQSAEAVRQAQVFIIWVFPWVAYNAISLLGARQRFAALTVLRVGQPLLYAVALAVLWATGWVGVEQVLGAQVLSFVVPAAVGITLLVRESGVGPVDRDLHRRGFRYGLAAFGSTLGFLTNSRLDQMVLPAFIPAAEIGLYVVSVSAASMLVGLFGSINTVVFPSAARARGERAVQLTQRATRLVLAMSAATALLLGLGASVVVRALYGEQFLGSVTPLRLLLPGVCFWAASTVVISGLKGIGRPGAASVAQATGVVVTVIGLALLLRRHGIVGAAITSSVAYTTVFTVALVAFCRTTGTRAADALGPHHLVDDARAVAALVRRRSAPPDAETGSP